MKSIVCVCFFALVATVLARPHDEHGGHHDHYTDKYDHVNVDEILANDRLLMPYTKCILDEAKCAADAKELKIHIKDALETHCDKCTDVQKEQTKKVIKYMINNKEADWKKLVTKYDPEHKYSKKYEDELRTIKA